jgi:hypothetical protein
MSRVDDWNFNHENMGILFLILWTFMVIFIGFNGYV